jgi:hypothetical protein
MLRIVVEEALSVDAVTRRRAIESTASAAATDTAGAATSRCWDAMFFRGRGPTGETGCFPRASERRGEAAASVYSK